VRSEIGGNGKTCPTIERTIVTTGATVLRPRSASHVLRMIKSDIKSLFEVIRKILQRRPRGACVGMADETHRHSGSYKL